MRTTRLYPTSMNKLLKYSLACLFFALACPTIQAQTDWKSYPYPAVNCSINFPAPPTTAQEGDVWTAQAKHEDVIYQIVVYINKQYAKTNVEAVLAESMNGFINPATDQIEKTESLIINGLPAKQVYVRSQDGSYLVFQTLASNTKLYQLAIAGTNPAQTAAKAKKFLDSFKIE